MVIGELAIPNPDRITRLEDIPHDTLRALEIIEPALYGGPLKTVGRAACLLRYMYRATYNLGARPVVGAPPNGVAIVHANTLDLWVQSLAVAPECRGEGVGTALMQDIERIGRQEQLRQIKLRVMGESAIGFYERLGYCPMLDSSEDSIVLDLHKPLTA